MVKETFLNWRPPLQKIVASPTPMLYIHSRLAMADKKTVLRLPFFLSGSQVFAAHTELEIM